MAVRETLERYNIIVRKLRKGPASIKEIADYLSDQCEDPGKSSPISIRTFHRDRKDIAYLFDFCIEYNKEIRLYELIEGENQEIGNRMLEAFDTIHALNRSEKLTDVVHLENCKPRGTEHLSPLLRAIKGRKKISFIYQKFDRESSCV
ncbi:MAG: hypothetical protein ACEPOZ_20005 [Marinifilaceae bacterium]